MQFRTCNHGEPCLSPLTAKERGHFPVGEKNVEKPLVNKESIHGFSLAESVSGSKRSLSSSFWALLPSKDVRGPLLVSLLYLTEISVY